MSQEKAQLIAPQGHFTVPGLNVAGVVTASSFSGNCTGTASSITKGTNVVVGVMTASSFAGDVFGNAAGLSTTTAGLKLGIVTATSFGGNFTGIGSGLTGTPNIVAGLVTATQFVGNTPGLAGGISAGKNLHAGIITATTFYGDGSNLTGAGSTAYLRQTVGIAETSSTTTNINLTNGNIINFEHHGSPTLAFYNANTADDITIIRPLVDPSFTPGGVTFDGTDDCLTLAATTDFDFGTGDFTIEFWMNPEGNDNDGTCALGNYGDPGGFELVFSGSTNMLSWYFDDGTNSDYRIENVPINKNQWNHVALVRSGNTITLYSNGTNEGTYNASGKSVGHGGNNTFRIGCSGGASPGNFFDGKLSNFRIVKGTAVYTANFILPLVDLANITNTKLLCCQDTSSTTTAAVKPGTITAVSSPSAGSQTISQSLGSALTWPSSITWNGGSAPTLVSSNVRSTAGQVFNLTTADGGTTWYGYEEVNSDPGTFALWAWGSDTTGALAQNDDGVKRSSPIQIGSEITWSRLIHGQGGAAAAIKTDNTLWVWGSNENYGALGQNQAGSGAGTVSPGRSSPVQIPGTTWSQLGGGGGDNECLIATKTDGTLWGWGRNTWGQLGNNKSINYSSPVQVPGTTWSFATAGAAYNFAIKTDGTLWTMGSGLIGGTAQNNRTSYSSPVQIPGTTWSTIAAAGEGLGATKAVKSDGTLWAWGDGGTGSTGQNDNIRYSSPVQIPGTTWSTDIKANGCGYYHQLAIKTDGTLWVWGYDQQGCLGQNEASVHYSSPVQIPGTTWASVNGGRTVSAAIKTDGTLWVWGYGAYGSLGQNNTVAYSSPVQVPGTWGTDDYQLGHLNRDIYVLKPE